MRMHTYIYICICMHTHPQEDHFEARALLAGQSEELDALREQARYICTATYAYAYAYA
jgi:hypothetical protein